MSRLAKWKPEKTKVKLVFRLQFHATHIPPSGWDKLFIACVPADSDKATAKTTKANVRSGNCKWADPIYETTRLLFDTRTKQYDEKVYKLVVAMGMTRSSTLGEATINLADYAAALKPVVASLPLFGTDSGAVLHVTVQLLTSKTGFREFEQQRELREKGFVDHNSPDESSRVKVVSSEETQNNQTDKMELSFPQHKVNESGSDVQKVVYIPTKELVSQEQLIEEVSPSKSESSSLKELNTFKSVSGIEDQDQLSHNLKQTWLNGLVVIEGKIKEIQNKAFYEYHNKDYRFFAADVEALLTALLDLKQGISNPASSPNSTEVKELALGKPEQLLKEVGFGIDVSQPEFGLHHYLGLPGLVPQDLDSVESSNAMKVKIFDLLRELDESKVERENLVKKMDQMECYYESLVQELEENQRQMLRDLESLRNENSTCLYSLNSANSEIETMRHDMNEQILRFKEEKHALNSLVQETEKRAFTAEAALKRARLNYSIAVNHLQKDLELLSNQVMSMYESNENLIKQAFPDSSQPSGVIYPQKIQYKKTDGKLGVREQSLGGDILLKDLERSLNVQRELHRKVESELHDMHMHNVYLDVYSRILQETLLETGYNLNCMEEKISELSWHLDLSTEAKELLKQRLDCALDEALYLNEDKATSVAKCNDLILQKEDLEKRIQRITLENQSLEEKVAEMDFLLLQYKDYKSKYDTCILEKIELSNSLEKEVVDKVYLQNKISSLQAVLEETKGKFNDLSSSNKNFQVIVDSLRDKLLSLFDSYTKKSTDMSCRVEEINNDCRLEDLEIVAAKLEQLYGNACEIIVQLSSEKKDLEDQMNNAQTSLNAAESENMQIKQKYKRDIWSLLDKLQASDALVENLQLKVDAIVDWLNLGSGLELKLEHNQEELIQSINYLETEMQRLLWKDEEFTREIFSLESSALESKSNRLLIEKLTEEKQSLEMLLQEKSQDSSEFAEELKTMRENFQFLSEELEESQSLKGIQTAKIEDLLSQLKESQQSNDVLECRLKVLNSKLDTKHLESLGFEESLRRESLRAHVLECHLSEMFELSVAADIQYTYLRTQCEVYVGELVQQINCSNRCLAMLQKKHLKAETALSQQNENEAEFTKENARLLTSLDMIRSELKDERSLRESLEGKLEEVASQLDEKLLELQQLDEQRSELGHLKQMVSVLGLEKLCQSQKESDCISELKSQFANVYEYALEADIQFIFVRTQSVAYIEELLLKFELFDRRFQDLQCKNLDLETALNCCLVNEAQWKEENTRLLADLEALKSKLEASTADNSVLIEREVGQLEVRNPGLELQKLNSDDKSKLVCEAEKLKDLLAHYEEEIENLIVSNEEQGIEVEVLKSIAIEYQAEIKSRAADVDEIKRLKKQCDEVTMKLSEQILKTEEFRNLSIHLKELKDRAESESFEAREKQYESPMSPAQESLRIIFIKEQYESKLQELKSQLSMSKKHSEEILLKLQDAVDEIEARGRSEACQIKRNEELKAELDCALISLDCCKEEKQRLEASLHKCNAEKLEISLELNTVKELFENTKSDLDPQNNERNKLVHVKEILLDEEDSIRSEEPFQTCITPSTVDDSRPMIQNVGVQRSLGRKKSQSPSSDRGEFSAINDGFRSQTLRTSLDLLNNELEKMRKENLLDTEEDHDLSYNFLGFEREVSQLRKANEQLKDMFPLFEEYTSYGNALERVLALEIELAEALRTKKKSGINFQSAFLRQHSDDEALFQSFKDINDLIEEMLQTKCRYTTLESELKDMHDRYSQLSLQFAEVEGERQKLMMTLRNVRACKKDIQVNRSSSLSLVGDIS